MTVTSDVDPTNTGAAPGSIVVIRDEEWLVRSVRHTGDGELLEVTGLSELVREEEAAFYASLDDVEVLDPAAATVVADDTPHYRRSRLWLEATLAKLPVPIGSDDVTLASDMLMDPLSYQQTAVRKALDPNNLRPRLLLADAVGLGKTMEIGMILAELVRRGRGERILVVTPKHVLEQMQHELWCRFALPFVRLDSTGLQRVRQKLPATRNPFSLYRRAIISIDTLKSDKYLAHLRKTHWDAVVIDESHNVTNSATQNNRLAATLAPNTDALILASATPHNGKAESFAELMSLLEPTSVQPDGELRKGAIERLAVRRHRNSPEVARVVSSDWAPRKDPLMLLTPASDAEDAVATELNDVWLHPTSGESPYSGKTSALFPWTLAKAFLSSPAALNETIANRIKRLDATPQADREREALERLASLAAEVTARKSAKYQRLLEHLNSIGVGKGKDTRVVIFAERVATLNWLQKSLQKDLKCKGDAIRIMHGGLDDVTQQELVEEFKQAGSPLRILVTGDVASEGVNLHTECHNLVHFDVPWSLIRVEQRNGRIDRYGQRHEPLIATLLLEPSSEGFAGDIRVLQRLVEKEREAHEALGDVAPLMGEYSADAEEKTIRELLAKGRDLDSAVPAVSEVISGPEAILALLAPGITPSQPASQVQDSAADGGADAVQATAPTYDVPGRTVHEEPIDFVRQGMYEVYRDPSASPASSGVGWRDDEQARIASFVPPADLRARLDLLPQSYLRDRGVMDRLLLAYSKPQGKKELKAARDVGTTSPWPEAHFLGPLHPVMGWIADRALSSLSRGEVFAVRGDVKAPTVLTVTTLTNKRGMLVARQFVKVDFSLGPSVPSASAIPTAKDFFEAINFGPQSKNPGPLDTSDLEELIRPAVEGARNTFATTLLGSLQMRAEEGLKRWQQRIAEWDLAAQGLPSTERLRRFGRLVEAEKRVVQQMTLTDPLTRPLLVVCPRDTPVAERPSS